MGDKISDHVTGFRKSYGTQHSLVIMLERWKKLLIKKNIFLWYIWNLSKTFDTVIHDLLLTKVRANGFSGSALNWLYNYLKSRKQKVVINDKISSSAVIIAGALQGSIEGPLQFNYKRPHFIPVDYSFKQLRRWQQPLCYR